jgi:hypothetical protein
MEGMTYKLEITEGMDLNSDGKIDLSDVVKTTLKENGDFRSAECIEFLKEADIVITNPPFSLFGEYVEQLIEYDKKFLIIGDQNKVNSKGLFKLIKDNKMWLGVSPRSMNFKDYDGNEHCVNANWYTNLEHKKRNEEIILYKKYNEKDFPKYDNYDAIEVSKVADIPIDYEGIMGVPITFLEKHNPNQFEILGDSRYHDGNDNADDINFINGKGLYRRILIKHKHPRKKVGDAETSLV